MQEKESKPMFINGNHIVLKLVSHNESNQPNGFKAWFGEYLIQSCTRTATAEDVQELIGMGVFGQGQNICATLSPCNKYISYSGTFGITNSSD